MKTMGGFFCLKVYLGKVQLGIIHGQTDSRNSEWSIQSEAQQRNKRN